MLTVDLASVALGGKICSVSDEFFAEADNLLKVAPAVRELGRFTERGAWMDGWESKRHNESFDWVIIKLGVASGQISGFDIDTSHFNGNHCPEATIEAIFSPDATPTTESNWTMILPKVKCGASSRHLFAIPTTTPYTHIKLNMIPDGGIARFRVYGTVIPVLPKNPHNTLDLAYVGNGGRATACSDQHFGTKDNLLLPGRGVNMGDGWETARSRAENHSDWVIVRLAVPQGGWLEYVEIDTAHFIGNYPKHVQIEATYAEGDVPGDTAQWAILLNKTARGILDANKRHFFRLNEALIAQRPYTHVRMTIFPDGGIKRLRVFGRMAKPDEDHPLSPLPE